MARLPQATDLQRQPAPASSPGIRVGQIDYGLESRNKSGGIAGGLQSIAGGLEAIGKQQEEIDDYDTRKKLLDFKLETEMALEEHKRSMPVGGDGFAASWEQEATRRSNAFFGKNGANISPMQRQKVDLALVQHNTILSERAQRSEMAERDRREIEGLEETLGKTRSFVEADPKRQEEMRAEGRKLIESSRIPPADRLRLAHKYDKEIDKTSAVTRLMMARTAEDYATLKEDLAPDIAEKRAASGIGPGPYFNAEINGVIEGAAAKHGVDPAMLRTFAKIESGGNPKNTTGSYKGLFQLSEGEFRKHGGNGDIYDPQANAEAAARKLKSESDAFAMRTGRQPSAAELYMVHQQGEGGSAAHAANPDAPAWQNMASTGEGRQKGETWAKKAIWGNIPDADKKTFGSVENVTSKDFLALWERKVANLSGARPGAPAPEDGAGEGYAGPYAKLNITERKALWQQAEVQQRKMSEGLLTEIKEYSGNAAIGKLPPDEVVKDLGDRVKATGDPRVAAAYHSTLGLADMTRTLQNAPPIAVENLAKQIETQLGDTAMPEEQKRLEHVKKLAETMRKQTNEDPMTWAHQRRVMVPVGEPGSEGAAFQEPIVLDRLDMMAPDADITLARRAHQARRVGEFYGQEPKFFTKIERDALGDVMRKGGGPMLDVLGKMHKAFGNDMVLAMKEISKNAPEVAIMGKLMAEGGDPKLLEDAAKSLKLRQELGDKFISSVDKKQAEPDVQALNGVLAKTPGIIDPIRRATDAVYEYRHRYLGKDKFDPDLYKKIMGEVMGEVSGPDGTKYGGVGKQGAGWFDGKWSSNVLVPPGVRQDGFDDMVSLVTDKDLQTSKPYHVTGKPLTAGEVRRATWISVGSGRYVLQTGAEANGEPNFALDPQDPKRPFILDVRPLLGEFRKRKPELFANP